MGAFDSDFAQCAGLLSEALASDVPCTPVGGTEISVNVIVRGQSTTTDSGQNGQSRKHLSWLSVPRTSAAAGGGTCLANPAIGDLWTLEGQQYVCEAIESQSAAFSTIRVVREAAHEVTRQGYRLRG
ncbi:MAG: hypothetical protein WC107_06290 [Patescibacteria group bacterium]|jgi:hypothetical protein